MDPIVPFIKYHHCVQWKLQQMVYFRGSFKEQVINHVKIYFKFHTFYSFVPNVASIETPLGHVVTSYLVAILLVFQLRKTYYSFDTHHCQLDHWSLDKKMLPLLSTTHMHMLLFILMVLIRIFC